MRYLTIAVALGCLLQGPMSFAQPAESDEPGLAPAPPRAMPAPPITTAQNRHGRGMTRHQLHTYLMEHNPAYRSNRRMMLSGILVASVGGGLGALLTVAGLSGMMAYGLTYGHSGEYDSFPYLLGVGLTTMVISLAVGLPLALAGRGRASTILKRHMRFSAGVLPGAGTVGFTWHF